jgi:hypothetical protein
MEKKAKLKSARGKQKRLSPDHRGREFVAKATEFFSEQDLAAAPAIWRAG